MVFPTPGTNPRSPHDPRRRHHREPGHRRAHRLSADEPRDERPGRRDRDLRAAERLVAAAHVHPSQEERFEILRGSVGFRIGRKKLVAGPGQRLTVPAGTPHKFWNGGEEEAHFVCEVRPALQFEALLETMFALAADGKTNRKGMPNPLRLAVIANARFDTVRLPFAPAIVQRI